MIEFISLNDEEDIEPIVQRIRSILEIGPYTSVILKDIRPLHADVKTSQKLENIIGYPSTPHIAIQDTYGVYSINETAELYFENDAFHVYQTSGSGVRLHWIFKQEQQND